MTKPFDFRDIDEVVHGAVRLGAMAFLSTAGSVEFQELKRRLQVSDGNLSVHLKKLEDAGYITVTKRGAGRASLTRIMLTKAGRAAFSGYLEAMAGLAREVRETS